MHVRRQFFPISAYSLLVISSDSLVMVYLAELTREDKMQERTHRHIHDYLHQTSVKPDVSPPSSIVYVWARGAAHHLQQISDGVVSPHAAASIVVLGPQDDNHLCLARQAPAHLRCGDQNLQNRSLLSETMQENRCKTEPARQNESVRVSNTVEAVQSVHSLKLLSCIF